MLLRQYDDGIGLVANAGVRFCSRSVTGKISDFENELHQNADCTKGVKEHIP